ncbi:LINE-1 reverse transcriptase [Thelohanellus kitauei]|uniref:LINE-1 reverse transcriptase n=1 Tax=Thelohanellus kitauei TaxID=669202 RepID=A0A0C2J371_THEKT|nr:LINE-1 reverse transcriptase [Thelohanellus kitauei]
MECHRSSTHDNNLLDCITRLINRVLRKREKTIVPIPEKGDFSCIDNYRRISLIIIATKNIANIILARIKPRLEETLALERAVFRSAKEYPSHIAILYELCKRRQPTQTDTHLCFLDFSSGHDIKLTALGVDHKLVRMVKCQYTNANANVRIPGSARTIHTFDINKGVRQGCRLSPILFNIFINELYVKLRENRLLIGELHYADDLVISTSSEDTLRLQIIVLENFSREKRLKVNAACVYVHRGEFKIDADIIPLVSEYRYLAGLLRTDRSWDHFVMNYVAEGNRCSGALFRFLTERIVLFGKREIATLNQYSHFVPTNDVNGCCHEGAAKVTEMAVSGVEVGASVTSLVQRLDITMDHMSSISSLLG